MKGAGARYLRRAALSALLVVVTILPATWAAPPSTPPGQGKKPTPSPTSSPAPTASPSPVPSSTPIPTASPSPSATPAPAPPAATKTLVLYDASGDWAHLGELFAIQVSNLSGHFGTYTAKPVGQYTAGEMLNYSAVVYVGNAYGEVLPTAFTTDVVGGARPVMWMEHNIHELRNRTPNFQELYGWDPGPYYDGAVDEIRYKGESFRRRSEGNGRIVTHNALDTSRVQVLAEAVRADGTTFPWAIRSGNLFYIGEVPFTYASEQDRAVVFSDLMFELLAPNTPERHRALVRLEDVGPDADPEKLRAIADYLYSRGVPFSVAVYTQYVDPHGVYNNGVPESFSMSKTPWVADALRYMVSKGGTLLMHGYSHQYKDVANPYDGVSGNDFEFFMAHVDAENFVRYDGPVPDDSRRYALGRVDSAIREFKAANLPIPTIFEFPHYAGSDTDYRAIAERFTTRYERGLYFKGSLSGSAIDHSKMAGQIFPYPVRDIYGTKVLPENLGNYEPVSYNNHPTRFPPEMIETARKNLVVRDGFASFFFHPFLELEALKETVEGIQALGYRFVAPTSL